METPIFLLGWPSIVVKKCVFLRHITWPGIGGRDKPGELPSLGTTETTGDDGGFVGGR